MSRSRTFWNARAAAHDRRQDRRHAKEFDNRRDAVLARLGPEDRVLELGCATGEMALAVAPEVAAYLGADLSGRMIALARQKALARGAPATLAFREADAMEIDPEEARYDAVLAFNLLHFLPDPEAAMARIFALTRPGGQFLSETPCIGDWPLLAKLGLRAAERLSHAPNFHEFTAAGLEALITGAGFEIDARDKIGTVRHGWWFAAERPE